MKSIKFFVQKVLPLVSLLFAMHACRATDTALRYNDSKTYSAQVEAESGGTLYLDETQADIIITGENQNEIEWRLGCEIDAEIVIVVKLGITKR